MWFVYACREVLHLFSLYGCALWFWSDFTSKVTEYLVQVIVFFMCPFFSLRIVELVQAELAVSILLSLSPAEQYTHKIQEHLNINMLRKNKNSVVILGM